MLKNTVGVVSYSGLDLLLEGEGVTLANGGGCPPGGSLTWPQEGFAHLNRPQHFHHLPTSATPPETGGSNGILVKYKQEGSL